MAEQNNHINFSLADIERYLQGRMLPKEMHDMEKAALQDPFLADAIEGFSQASSEVSNKHLNEIAAALQSKDEATKVVPIVQRSKVQWWKIAAMVIVIVGAGSASWLILKQNNVPADVAQTQVKKNTTEPAAIQPHAASADSVAPVLADANKPVRQKAENISKDIPLPKAQAQVLAQTTDSARVLALAKNQELYAKKSMMADAAPAMAAAPQVQASATPPDSFTLQNMDKNVSNNAVIAQGPSSGYSNRISAPESANLYRSKTITTSGVAAKQNSFQLKGRVLNNNAQPVPSALVKLANGKGATFTDEQGFFTLYSFDSVSNVNISSAGYASVESNLRKGMPNTISLKEDDKSLSEVVVTELRSRKEVSGKLAGAEAKGKEPYPEKGWPSFQEYVYTKLNKEHEYDSTYTGTVTGRSVELEFMVDANGNPYNFKILHSVDEASDRKAIEIVKQGPRWITTNKKVKKAKVTIKL